MVPQLPFVPAYTITAPDDAAYQQLEQAFRQDLSQVDMGSPTLPIHIAFNPETRAVYSGYALDVMQSILPPNGKVIELLPIRSTLYGFFKDVKGDTFQAGDYSITRTDGNPFIEKDRELAAAEQVAALLPPKQTMAACSPDTPPHQLVTSLLDMYQGVCMGETHTETPARMLIVQQMEEWRKKGVKKIFIEALRREFNPMLRHYYATPDAQLPPVIGKWLAQAEERTKFTMKGDYQTNHLLQDVVKSAKQHGIEVYGIGSAIAFVPGLRSKDRPTRLHAFYERGILLNALATETIRSLLAPDDKFVVLTGAGHTQRIPFADLKKTIPGLGHFLGAPSVIIATCKQGEPPRLEEPPKDMEVEHICWLDPVVLSALGKAPPADAPAAKYMASARRAGR